MPKYKIYTYGPNSWKVGPGREKEFLEDHPLAVLSRTEYIFDPVDTKRELFLQNSQESDTGTIEQIGGDDFDVRNQP